MFLEIITHFDNKQATIGSNVTLTCTSSLSSDVIFIWAHNDTIIKHQELNSSTSRLTISNVRYNDSGSYMCIVWKRLSVTSDIATITVYGKLNNNDSCVSYIPYLITLQFPNQ